MSKARARPIHLKPAAVQELLNPTRVEIYESLQVSGPTSIAELAARLGRRPDSLYYHVRKLVEIGVVEQREGESTGLGNPGRNGAVFAVAPGTIAITLDPTSKASREAWKKAASAVLRLAGRDCHDAIDAGTARVDGVHRNLVAARTKVRLTRRQLGEVNRHLDATQELLCQHKANARGERIGVTIVMSPLASREAEEDRSP